MKFRLITVSVAVSVFMAVSCGLPTKEYERVTALRDTVNKYTEIRTFAQSDFDIAEERYAEADIIMKEENKDEADRAKKLLLEAETNYNLVLDKGLPSYSEILKKQMDDNATNARQIKSDVMYNEEYNQAETMYKEANELYASESKDYRVLADKLYRTKEAYSSLYNKTKENFDKSDAALAKVKERLAELESMVKEIETLEKEQN